MSTLAVTNNAAVDTSDKPSCRGRLSFLSFLLGACLAVEFLGHKVTMFKLLRSWEAVL